ncbi:MAG: hypothetical protein A2W91_11875 [Bacteroidetes bacterium GWF2_38_335]|nr:MAG: hypothetical protein A2W91_11875 [Bacteroidetes bacterium GWF2_38_335]OFY77976.1 MAG: hypothetical protein A2281_18620 [Bacteroidetes bacterium RIFOXYA12_FULL_38_20]HBS86719.1 hypothetical protein [Bacteroidales bacterium]
MEYITISGVAGGDAIGTTYGVSALPTLCLIKPDHSVVLQDIWPISAVSDIITPLEGQGLSETACSSVLTANFSATPTTIMVGGSVNFNDGSSGTPTSWSWTFPGGTPGTSTAENPTGIVYNTAGTYDVTLEVSDGTSTHSTTKTAYIFVSEDAVYCDAGSTGVYEFIDAVSFGTIVSTATGIGAGGYQDHTDMTTNILQGNTYPITITLGSGYASDQGRVWIDWNQDGDHLDADEMVFESTVGVGPYSGNITVPATATLGETVMRIRVWDTSSAGANNTPCGDADWGEVEDYNVVVESSGVSVNEMNSVSYLIYPNPAENEVFVNVGNSNVNKIELTDITGKVLMVTEKINDLNKFDLSGKVAGMYFFRIYTDSSVKTHKIIVK